MLIATDSIPASINVGQDVPTLTSQALTGAQSGGNSLFANTVSSRNSGVTLSILARVTDSGIVTLVIDQEVSSAQAPSASAAIQSPSFQTRSISTQVTVQDGDTIAIGGIIQDTNASSSAGVPFLHRLPVIGAAFGAKSSSKGRTELVIFMTPQRDLRHQRHRRSQRRGEVQAEAALQDRHRVTAYYSSSSSHAKPQQTPRKHLEVFAAWRLGARHRFPWLCLMRSAAGRRPARGPSATSYIGIHRPCRKSRTTTTRSS